MESNESSSLTPDVARSALDGVAQARQRMTGRLIAPAWYHPATGLSVAGAFASAGLPREFIPFGVIFGIGLIPTALSLIVRRVSGVAFDRYIATPTARRLLSIYVALLGVLAAATIVLRWGMDLRLAPIACAVVAFLLTLATGLAADKALTRSAQS
ncbi:hypothetical protein ACLMAJ_31000 [Nocardia sp. KC 131]|uniref:hypothetical protein n=1 Tax=Nocardia arseniciresistens TaxID=3392119 RepID=UPI00398E55FB